MKRHAAAEKLPARKEEAPPRLGLSPIVFTRSSTAGATLA
jgi:hypothetical protein